MIDKVCNITSQGRVETKTGMQMQELQLCGSRSQGLVACDWLLDLV